VNEFGLNARLRKLAKRIRCADEWPARGEAEHTHRCEVFAGHTGPHRCACNANRDGPAAKGGPRMGRPS
jgi:hypothetical protein